MDMDVGSDSDFEDRAVSMAARKWSKANIKTLEARVLSLGFGRAAEVAATASLPPYVDASEAEAHGARRVRQLGGQAQLKRRLLARVDSNGSTISGGHATFFMPRWAD